MNLIYSHLSAAILKAADAMGKLCEEMRKYWTESATLSEELRVKWELGNIGAMWTLEKTVKILRMDGHSGLAVEVIQYQNFNNKKRIQTQVVQTVMLSTTKPVTQI